MTGKFWKTLANIFLALTILAYGVLFITAMTEGIPLFAVLFVADLGAGMIGGTGTDSLSFLIALLISKRNLFLLGFIICRVVAHFCKSEAATEGQKPADETKTDETPTPTPEAQQSVKIAPTTAQTTAQARPASTTTKTTAQAQPSAKSASTTAQTTAQAQPSAKSASTTAQTTAQAQPSTKTAPTGGASASKPKEPQMMQIKARMEALHRNSNINFSLYVTHAFVVKGRGTVVAGYLLGNVTVGEQASVSGQSGAPWWVIGIERHQRLLNSLEAPNFNCSTPCGCGILLSETVAPDSLTDRILVG